MKRIYLDYAAATPVDKRVKEKMEPFFFEIFGNPSSVHQEGQRALTAIQKARKQVAELLHAQPEEIIFTSGTTESINLAFAGVQKKQGGKIATTSTEHHAGIVAESEVITEEISGENLLEKNVTLLSAMWVNNETGAKTDIHTIAKELQKTEKNFGRRPLLHSDIAQALLTEEISCEKTMVDLLSFGSGKIYGPKGVGALYVRKGTPIAKVWSGGSQENKLRPGTENVAGIVGFGEACEILKNEREHMRTHIQACKDAFLHGLKKEGAHMRVNGGENCAPHIANITFFNADAEELVIRLDAAGVACSAASACKRGGERSHVLRAMGMNDEEIRATARFSFGGPLTINDATHAAALTAECVKRMLL